MPSSMDDFIIICMGIFTLTILAIAACMLLMELAKLVDEGLTWAWRKVRHVR